MIDKDEIYRRNYELLGRPSVSDQLWYNDFWRERIADLRQRILLDNVTVAIVTPLVGALCAASIVISPLYLFHVAMLLWLIRWRQSQNRRARDELHELTSVPHARLLRP